MRVSPERVDAAWVVVAGVWPGGLGVDQVRDDGAFRRKLTRLAGHESPLGLDVVFGVGPRRLVGLRVVHVIAPHPTSITHRPGHLRALVVFQFLLNRERLGMAQAGIVKGGGGGDQPGRVKEAEVHRLCCVCRLTVGAGKHQVAHPRLGGFELFRVEHRRGNPVVVIAGVGGKGKADLAEVVGATGSLCLVLGLAECREQQRGEDRNDGDHHEQLDQGERP